MEIFQTIQDYGHEQVVICSDKTSGLKAFIGIHNTTLGPALGGTRMWNYATDEEALIDVLRLSRGMTYKAAVAGLNLGGGKAVIVGNPHTDKNEALFRAFGRYIQSLHGRYITAEDVGTSVADMEWIKIETDYVTGVQSQGGSGDPSPVTAFGVYHGMKACAKYTYGSDSLSGRTIAMQGAGNVAKYLAAHLVKEGAKVLVSDIYTEKANKLADELGCTVVEPDKIMSIDCDIFSPNALGSIINEQTIPELKCAIVAGGANNQMKNEVTDGYLLKQRGINYAPDYVINAGGLMNVASEVVGYNQKAVLTSAEGIYGIVMNILTLANDQNIIPSEASNKIAEERIAKIGKIHNVYNSIPTIRGIK